MYDIVCTRETRLGHYPVYTASFFTDTIRQRRNDDDGGGSSLSRAVVVYIVLVNEHCSRDSTHTHTRTRLTKIRGRRRRRRRQVYGERVGEGCEESVKPTVERGAREPVSKNKTSLV